MDGLERARAEEIAFDDFSMELDDQSKIRIGREEEGYVFLHVGKVKVTIIKDGETTIHRTTHGTKLKKEDGRWKIWWKY